MNKITELIDGMELRDLEDILRSTLKQPCRWSNDYICHIEHIKEQYFMKAGNTIGCAGFCDACLKKNTCEHICDYAKQPEEFVDAAYRKMPVGSLAMLQESVEDSLKQPEFPVLRNMAQREEWVRAYQDWPIWCRNDLTEEIFYRYNFPDDVSIIVKEYPYTCCWAGEKVGTVLYLQCPEHKHFKDTESNMTVIKEHLKI